MTIHSPYRYTISNFPVRPKYDSDIPSYVLATEQTVSSWNFPESSICLKTLTETNLNILSSSYFNIYIEDLFLIFQVDGVEKYSFSVTFPLVLGISYIESTFTLHINGIATEQYLPLDRNLGTVTLFDNSALVSFQSRLYTYRKAFIPDCLDLIFDVSSYSFAFKPVSFSSPYSKQLLPVYTLIAKGDVPDGLVAGVWEELGYQDWRIDREDSTLRLTVRQVPNIVESFTVEKLYELAVVREYNQITLYINGINVFSSSTQFGTPTNNVISGTNITTELYSYKFVTEDYYVASYTPVCFNTVPIIAAQDRRYLNYEYLNSNSDLEYSISGDSLVSANSLETYTIQLSGRSRTAKSYPVRISPKYSFDTVQGINLSTNVVTIPANTLTSTLTLTFTNIANPTYNRPFSLHVGEEQFDIVINSYNSFDWIFPSWNSYLSGYLYDASIPTDIELDDTLLVETNSAYGTALQAATALFDSNVENVRSIAVLYNEQTAVSYRTYVENELSTYLFNGGADGSLIGSPDPAISFAEFLKVLELSAYTYSVAIAPNDSSLALIDYETNKLKIYETVAGRWDVNNVTEIQLEHSTANSSIAYCSDSSALLIGLPEAGNGEGRAIIYRNSLSGWFRELILGSPVPTPTFGGFGYSLASNADATVLYVSELGSSTVYTFTKQGSLWSADPVDAFIGVERFGFDMASSDDASVLVICNPDEAAYVYVNGTLAHTRTGEYNSVEYRDGYILLSSLTANETVELDSLYTVEQTLPYGNIALYDTDRNIAILDADKTVRVYKNASTYTVSTNAYSMALSSNNLLVSDIDTELVELFTDNALFLPNIVSSVYLNGQLVPFNTVLETNKPAFIVINLSSSIDVRSLGSFNGLFYGIALFDSILTSSEVSTMWLKLKQYYKLEEYSIYAT